MARKPSITSAKQIIDQIEGSGGFITTIANRLGVARQTVYKALERYPTAKEAIADEKDKLIDMAEGAMMQKIKAGDNTMIIFFLKTQAKGRGYIEKQQIEQSGGIDVRVIYENSDNR